MSTDEHRSVPGLIVAAIRYMHPIDAQRGIRTTRRMLLSLAAAITLLTVLSVLISPALMGTGSPQEALFTGAAILGLLFAYLMVVGLLPERWARIPAGGWGSIGSCLMILAVNVSTQDISAGSHFYYVFPVVYAAYMLRFGAAVAVCLVAVVAEGIGMQLLDQPKPLLTLLGLAATWFCVMWVLATSNRARIELDRELERQARVDHLTGAATRQVLDEAIAEIENTDDSDTSLLVVDIDRFKQINDRYGHPVGDVVLQHVTTLLRAGVRSGDLVCRLGGDELVVLLTQCDPAAAELRAESLVRSISENLPETGGRAIPVTVSIGVAHHVRGCGRECLYRAADEALYRAKRAGGARVGLHSGPAGTSRPPDTIPA